MKPKASKLLALVATCALQFTVDAQVVLEEDFESPDTTNYATFTMGQTLVTATNSWFVLANSVDLYEDAARTEAAAFDGGQAVDLTGSPGEGVMETIFATVPGTSYELVFHYARNALMDPSIGSALVEVIGDDVLLQHGIAHDPAMQPFSTFLQYTGSFSADSASTTLRFSSLNPGVAGITIDVISVSVASPTGTIDGSPILPRDTILGVSPNPFNPATQIEYLLEKAGAVELSIYDVSGRLVRNLIDHTQASGVHRVPWSGIGHDGRVISSGVYLVRLTTANGTVSRRLTLLK